MLEQIAHVPLIPEEELNEFAHALYGYLYFKLNIYKSAPKSGEHFKEVIGSAVLHARNSTSDFNIGVLEKSGCGMFPEVISQEICNLYPNDDYFKKLFFVSAFILEMVLWWSKSWMLRNYPVGPDMWRKMFRKNFESEFESHGGWQGLLQAATVFHEVPINEILPREHILPASLECVIQRLLELNSRPEQAAVDEATASLERLQVVQMEVDDASVFVAAQSSQAQDEIEMNQPRDVGQGKESKVGIQPEEVDDRSGPHSSTHGGIMAQTENLGEGTSGQSRKGAQDCLGGGRNLPEVMDDKSDPHSSSHGGNMAQTENLGESTTGRLGDCAQHSVSGRNPRKRSLNIPSKNDSDEESDSVSPSKAKVDKK